MFYKIKEVDAEKCNGCEKCAEVCSKNCFEMVEKDGMIVAEMTNPKACDACGDCIIACSHEARAISLQPLDKKKHGYVKEIKGFKCEACEKCIKLCPDKNIEMVEENGRIFAKIVDPKRCVADGNCSFCCHVDDKVYSDRK